MTTLALSRPTADTQPAPVGLSLSIVIPTYNERDNLRPLIARLQSALVGLSWEVIVVDDDSPDGTAALARTIARDEPRVRCLRRLDRRGLAGACVEGMLASSADVVAVMDADLQHDERILPLMLHHLDVGADLVIGSRAVAGGSSTAGFTPGRAVLSGFAIRCARTVLGTEARDVMSGFFMLRRGLADELAPQLTTSGFKLLADILASAPHGLRVAEVPYHFRARTAGASKLDARVGIDFVALMLNKATRGLIPFRFVFFGLAGGTGLLLHMAVLKVLLGHAAWSFQSDQAVATLLAMSSNFVLNNELTYRDARLRRGRLLMGLVLFYLVCSLGALANVGIATWLYQHGLVWWLAAGIGVAAGSIWNYALSSTYVWPLLRRRRKPRPVWS